MGVYMSLGKHPEVTKLGHTFACLSHSERVLSDCVFMGVWHAHAAQHTTHMEVRRNLCDSLLQGEALCWSVCLSYH